MFVNNSPSDIYIFQVPFEAPPTDIIAPGQTLEVQTFFYTIWTTGLPNGACLGALQVQALNGTITIS